jgi:hypothetical protein
MKELSPKKKAAAAAAQQKGVTVSTAEMCALSARMDAGSVTAGDLQLAARPVLALAQMLPADSALALRSASRCRRPADTTALHRSRPPTPRPGNSVCGRPGCRHLDQDMAQRPDLLRLEESARNR